MVRAGVVNHPSDWPFCGYNEIQNPRQRYSIIDYEGLMDLLNTKSMDELRKNYRGFVEEALQKQGRERKSRWTEGIAVGCEAFGRRHSFTFHGIVVKYPWTYSYKGIVLVSLHRSACSGQTGQALGA